MTEAETILKLIETVDPADTAKLDEIEIRVWHYIHQDGYVNERYFTHKKGMPIGGATQKCITIPGYTRSRDALKAIRPKGHTIDATSYKDGLWLFIFVNDNREFFSDPKGLREELAELHAIIQAIAYERQEKK